MGNGSALGSTLVEDDSPVEEVAVPVKAKKVEKRRQKSVTTANKESAKPWTTAEEVIDCFEKEMGSQSLGYDAIVSKWKNRVRPRIGAFCAIFDNV
nr:hypothetical protein [Tanacetum cinerariifolium]